ncbi:ParB/RepB/Spo0J family partition protein [Thioalkalivibrio sp. ALE19]|uniref:ParB/RepB/Spo0J family partition protein n=1 Tax=Thioalkalivibrio sp. ALE19 TaxID=1266909 RepID=UPI00048CBC36|nr:ParB/RepB/Spo0J family partition protein [Thioalkalivibrio sp. ALE19]
MNPSSTYGDLIDMLNRDELHDLKEDSSEGQMTTLPLSELRESPQVRKEFEDDENDLRSLADDIAQRGLIQPITVRPHPDGEGYEIIAGGRRFRASRLAERERVPVIIRDVGDEEAREIQMSENIHRKNLTQIEEARHLKKDLDDLGGDRDALLRKYNKNGSWLTKRLQLLSLGPNAQRLLDEDITADLEVIIGVRGIEEKAPSMAEEVVHQIENADRETNLRKLVAETKKQVPKTTGKAPKKKKNFKPKPARMPNPTRKTQPIHTFHQLVVNKKLSGEDALSRMDLDEREALQETLDHVFNEAKAAEDPEQLLIDKLRTHEMAGGGGVLSLALVRGIASNEDATPLEIVRKIPKGG